MIMKKFKSNILIYILAVIILGISMISTVMVVYADTDGKELKITAQPEKLVLNLGADFAGAEFELKFDSGVFPVPVKANSSGILTMELGGSKTYTLTRIIPVSATEPLKPNPTDMNPSSSDTTESGTESISLEGTTNTGDSNTTESTINDIIPPDNSVPVIPMIIFFSLLFLVGGSYLIIRTLKKRREEYDYDEDYDEYEDDEDENNDKDDDEK